MTTGVRNAIVTVLGVLALPMNGAAQVCPISADEKSLSISAGLGEQAKRGEAGDWDVGARIEWATSILPVSARASYHYHGLSGAALHIGSFGTVTRRLPLPARPCLTLDALVTLGRALSASGQYRNLTIPIALVFARSGTFTPFAGVETIYSFTSAELFSIAFRNYELGYGALAGARVQTGRFYSELTARATTLGAAIGPQPLGRLRVDLGIGLQL
jgi:hypothetical protein